MPPKMSRPKTKGDDPRGSRKSSDFGGQADRALDAEQQLRQAVALWLRWNETYEQVTMQAFQARHDQRKLEAIMDEMDSIRRQAIATSEKALSKSP
jgi:hypothetical protein